MALTVSPNMNLQIPGVGTEAGPTYATDINSSLSIIDQHDHSVGKGVQVNPAGILINADLPMNSNNLTLVRTVRFAPQGADPSLPSDLGILYVVGVDIYYRDVAGNVIRITQSGSVAGSTGTITGLPSGTASAAFSAGTFIFQAATLTGANIDGASYILRNNIASSFGLTLQPPNAMAADYSITLPVLPVTTSFVTIDTSGNMGASIPVSGGITGSNLTNSIDLPLYPTANTYKIVVSNTNPSTYPLSIIRGAVNSSGALIAGEGFSVSRIGTGLYNLSFSSSFADVPSVVFSSVQQIIIGPINFSNVTASGVTNISTNISSGTQADAAWSFIAIGQRS